MERGACYARTYVARELRTGVLATVGGQLLGGFGHTSRLRNDEGALDLMVPAAVALGSPDSYSIALYVAPYAEAGTTRPYISHICQPRQTGACGVSLGDRRLTAGGGIGLGTRLALKRFTLDVYMPGFTALRLGVNLRLGR